MKRSNLKGLSTKDYYQAGKSVAGISSVMDAQQVVREFAEALQGSKVSLK
jgi:hypothetical protein